MFQGVSIIIPAYNAATTIAATIQSLLLQSCHQWEAIIINDGSTDNTWDIVNEIAGTDNRIKIISQNNQGLNATRNNGIDAAIYDWLLFLDADDWIAPNYLEHVALMVNETPQVDVIHCGWVRVAPDGSLHKAVFAPDIPDFFPLLAYYCPFAVHACVVKKSVTVKAGKFDLSIFNCQDWDFWQRIARSGAIFKRIPEVLAYYRMHPQSLSSDGDQFSKDAFRVLIQGHKRDERITCANPLYIDGVSANLLLERKYNLLSWLGGKLIGSGKDAQHLLQFVEDSFHNRLDPQNIASNIFESALIAQSIPLSDWYKLYTAIQLKLKLFLQALEHHSKTDNLQKRVLIALEKKIISCSVFKEPITLEYTYGINVEVTHFIPDINVPSSAQQFVGNIKLEDNYIGTIELPVCNNTMYAWLLKDAIAAQFSWQILGRFLEHKYYRHLAGKNETNVFEDIHNKLGWHKFLQELWDKPDWEEADFYNNNLYDNSGPLCKIPPNSIEISSDLPNIETDASAITFVYKAGGAGIGTLSLKPKNNIISAHAIRAAITKNGGYQLCCAVVREALVGTSLADITSLKKRLQKAATSLQEHDTAVTFPWSPSPPSQSISNVLVLGRRKGLCSYFHVRRAVLPASATAYLIELANQEQADIIALPTSVAATKHIFYVPDVINAETTDTENIDLKKQKEIVENIYAQQRLISLFPKNAEACICTHPYEQTKYELTLSLIEGLDFENAMEIACADGHFTVQLAPYVHNLLATDMSTLALQRSADRCNHHKHIQYRHLDLIKEALPTGMDLIVCNEGLYYMDGLQHLKKVAQKICNALNSGGYLLMAHTHQIIDDAAQPGFDWPFPYGAKAIGDTFSSIASLQLKKEIRIPLYRIQLFQKKKEAFFSLFGNSKPQMIFKEQPAPVPPQLEASVRWHGGEASYKNGMNKAVTKKLPILLYHRIAPALPGKTDPYSITPAQFEEQLSFLKDCGYYSIDWKQWLAAMQTRQPLPGLAIALTFDGGYEDFYQYAWPLLQKYGFSATVFLVAKHVGKTSAWSSCYTESLPLMNWKQVQELQAAGITFGSNTYSHALLTGLSPDMVVEEAALSKLNIQKNTGAQVALLAYPYGDVDATTAHLVGATGYTIGLTSETRRSDFFDNPLLLPRIEIKGSDTLSDFIEKVIQ